MEFDIFFSISQTPDSTGLIPSEDQMYSNFFEQLDVADKIGFGVAWVAQAHLSTEIQKTNKKPVIPHWQGEVGLCTDFFQLAHQMFSRTKNIEVGSAVMSLFCNGGPIGMAERIGAFLALHGLNKNEKRKLNIGFSSGRFEFMARPYGIVPRNSIEDAAWPVLRSQIFLEACDIFLRLIKGEVVSSNDIRKTVLSRELFRDDESWELVQKAKRELEKDSGNHELIEIANRWEFEQIKTIPQKWNRDLLNLIAGTHNPDAQRFCNTIFPVNVFNLSITSPEIINETHERMNRFFHKDGGQWKRRNMPRTVFIFINEEEGLSKDEKNIEAKKEAEAALGSYWNALEGTIDPEKISKAANNALIGDSEEIIKQIKERFHPEDRLMTWFDFFNHDSERVCRNMTSFMKLVAPHFTK
ncbi:MAG: luciferase [Euryarchaeota archaeon]|jgi:hypothetical protein|nr:luciferase [Euryarchaeota archaeon]